MEKELSSAQKQVLLREQFQKKIRFLRSKKGLHQHEVRDLVRGLFKEWLGLNFEFTYEEAKDALDAIYIADDLRVKVESVLEDMNLAEFYQDHEQSEDELQEIVRKIDELLPKLLGVAEQQKDVIAKIFSTLRLPTFRKKQPLPPNAGVATPSLAAASWPPPLVATPAAIAPSSSDIALPSEAIAQETQIVQLRKQVETALAKQGVSVEQAPPVALEPESQPDSGPPDLVLTVGEDLPAVDDHALVIEDETPSHERIYERLERLYEALSKSRLDDAKSIYNDILAYYHPLPVDEKRKYYDVLFQVYQKLASS